MEYGEALAVMAVFLSPVAACIAYEVATMRHAKAPSVPEAGR